MLLLVAVSLICTSWWVSSNSSQAKPAVATRPTVLASDAPVRVVLPFTPNTTPSQR